jgi:transposase, IS5 family
VASWVGVIEPVYYSSMKGRKPKPIETMLRMYLLQVWFSLWRQPARNRLNKNTR